MAFIAPAIRAAMGANDLQLNGGSALDLQGDAARTTQQNVQATGYNSLVQAVGLRNQAIDYGSQAGLDVAQGENARRPGIRRRSRPSSVVRHPCLASGPASSRTEQVSRTTGTSTPVVWRRWIPPASPADQ